MNTNINLKEKSIIRDSFKSLSSEDFIKMWKSNIAKLLEKGIKENVDTINLWINAIDIEDVKQDIKKWIRLLVNNNWDYSLEKCYFKTNFILEIVYNWEQFIDIDNEEEWDSYTIRTYLNEDNMNNNKEECEYSVLIDRDYNTFSDEKIENIVEDIISIV